MKNILKKSLSVILCLTMLFSIFSVNFISTAAQIDSGSEIMPLWTTIDAYSAGFEVNGFTATASITLTSQVKTSLKLVVYLQKETSDGYETVKTWTKTGTGYGLSFEESATVNIFLNYRIKIVMTAGSETITVFRYED